MLQCATLKSIVGDSSLSRRPSHFHQLIQGNSKEALDSPGHPRDKISTALPWTCLWVSSRVDLTGTPLQGEAGEP